MNAFVLAASETAQDDLSWPTVVLGIAFLIFMGFFFWLMCKD